MISDKLKSLRMQAGLTQLELAKKAGLSLGTITQIEQKITKTPTSDVLIKLADTLCVSVDKLLGRKPPKN